VEGIQGEGWRKRNGVNVGRGFGSLYHLMMEYLAWFRSDYAKWSYSVGSALYPEEDVGGDKDGDLALWVERNILWTEVTRTTPYCQVKL